MSILTITVNPAIDKSSYTDRVEPDRKLRCDPPIHEPGGGGVNVSRAIHKLGGKSTALWACGGPTGQLLRRLLDTEGIQHKPIAIENLTRENLIIYERGSDRQFRFGMPGPATSDAEANRLIDRLGEMKPEFIVASGSLPPGVSHDFFARVANAGNEIGAKTIVDTSGDPLRRAADEGLYLLKPNLNELSQLAGRELNDDEEIDAAGRDLIDRGCVEAVSVSIGAGGARIIMRDSVHHITAPTVPIRSKVGAGDSMVGGLILGLSRGMNLLDAARLGVAAGAAAVMTPGTELCRRDDTARLYESMT